MQEPDEVEADSKAPECVFKNTQFKQPLNVANHLPEPKKAGEYYWNYMDRVSHPSSSNLINRGRAGCGTYQSNAPARHKHVSHHLHL
jgi:hypothetical protein